MKKNIFFLLPNLIALGVIIGLPFCFNNKSLLADNDVLVPYLIAKILFGVVLVAFVLMVFFLPKARGNALMLLVPTYVMQLVAPLLRISLLFSGFRLGFNIIVLAVTSIAYVVFIGAVFYQDKAMLVSDKKFEGKTIEVLSEEEAEAKNETK